MNSIRKKKKKNRFAPLTFENRQNKIPIPLSLLKERAVYFLSLLSKQKKHGIKPTTQVHFCFVNDREIKKWHKDYFYDSSPTDVISFPYRENNQKDKIDILGDVLISVDTAKRQAKEYGNKLNEELTLYMIHGVLHLLGYDDLAPSKKKVMDKLQFSLLEKVLAKKPLSGRKVSK